MIHAKLVDGKLELAPLVFVNADGSVLSRPTHADYLARGYKELLPPTMPTEEPPKGKHWAMDGYEETEATIRARWILVDNPPRVFSKMKAIVALTESGHWQAVKAWIEEAGLTDIFLAAQNFKEDDPFFVTGLTVLRSKLGLTEEQIEALLNACVGEG